MTAVKTVAENIAEILADSKAALYERAADWLEANPTRWVKGSIFRKTYSSEGQFCAVGAMHAVLTDPPTARALSRDEECRVGGRYLSSLRDAEAEVRTLTLVRDDLEYGSPNYASASGIVDLNDNNKTTLPEVISALRAVAAAIRAKDGTTKPVKTPPKLDIKDGPVTEPLPVKPARKMPECKRFSKDNQPTKEQRQKAMSRVFAKRLLALADLVEEKESAGRFYFNNWVGGIEGSWRGKPDFSCGTSACALGWATTMKSCRKAGLRMHTAHKHSDGTFTGNVCLKGDINGDKYISINESKAAAEEVLGVAPSHGDSVYQSEFYALFIPGSKGQFPGFTKTKDTSKGDVVAANIRAYVAWKHPKAYKELTGL